MNFAGKVALITGGARGIGRAYANALLNIGMRQTKQLPHVAKVDLMWQLGCNLGQSLSKHGPHVFNRRKIRRASQPGKQFNLVIERRTFGQCVPRVVTHYSVEIRL
ncbi:hypothetical protein TNCV_3329361 [Trichonephila clavipes]|nr:hypothetical protein TNCV_3329361 [Trichonephila clavipes]